MGGGVVHVGVVFSPPWGLWLFLLQLAEGRLRELEDLLEQASATDNLELCNFAPPQADTDSISSLDINSEDVILSHKHTIGFVGEGAAHSAIRAENSPPPSLSPRLDRLMHTHREEMCKAVAGWNSVFQETLLSFMAPPRRAASKRTSAVSNQPRSGSPVPSGLGSMRSSSPGPSLGMSTTDAATRNTPTHLAVPTDEGGGGGAGGGCGATRDSGSSSPSPSNMSGLSEAAQSASRISSTSGAATPQVAGGGGAAGGAEGGDGGGSATAPASIRGSISGVSSSAVSPSATPVAAGGNSESRPVSVLFFGGRWGRLEENEEIITHLSCVAPPALCFG